MFLTSYVFCGLRLYSSSRLKHKQYKQKTSPKKCKAEIDYLGK